MIEGLLDPADPNFTDFELRIPGSVTRNLKSEPRNDPISPPSLSGRKIRRLVVHAQAQPSRPWHLQDVDTVMASVESAWTGLSSVLADERLRKYGPNLLPEAVPRSDLSILLDQFKSLPVALLAASAVVSVFTGGLADAAVIMGVVIINAAIGYITESQAEKTINALTGMLHPAALVMREGRVQEIKAEGVVPGDILVLAPGSYIAADARLIEARHLSVDESALTGESMPVVKDPQRRLGREDIPLADRLNMVYRGTLVTGGQGRAVVVATGGSTEMGAIQTLVGEARPPETPMERPLDTLGRQLVILSGAVCGVVFVVGVLRGYSFIQMLTTSISLAVAAVPEGLPTIATTTLALGIRDMRKHKVLVRHLDAVEALGAVQVICMDKTGTLTMNRMSVAAVSAGMKRLSVSGGRFFHEGQVVDPFAHDELLRLIHAGVLCNETEINGGKGAYIVKGSPTEAALVELAVGAGIDVIELRRRYPLTRMDYRAENRNYMRTEHGAGDGKRIVALKGSPPEVLAMCLWHVQDGTRKMLTDADRLAIITENERMAGQALRVLGVAYAALGDGAEGELTWLGLVGMADPVRMGVKELIGRFHKAGIETVMITGDQTPTAYAIGKELGLSNGRPLEILDSTHLEKVDPELLSALAQRVDVFARVSPAHKLQIVQALQRAGKVVAMTGDGINDSPALKKADIGIAMGHTGTDVARSVADIVLEDDDLQTMIIAVGQGRTIYSNIRKSVHFLLATNLSEIMVMFAAIATGAGQPLNPMQLLWINLLTDIFPGLALSLEPPEPDVLSRPPGNPHDPIVRRADLQRIGVESVVISAGTLAAYGYGISRYGIGPQAGSLAFMTLTSVQILHALSCRSESHSIFDRNGLPPNNYLKLALGGSFAVQLLSATIPGLRNFLGVAPIGVIDGIVIGMGAVLPLLVNEGTKTLSGKISQPGQSSIHNARTEL
jgi:Ca2+-transporting ATPase